ncbi:ATP-binding cassette domain-containing protein [Cohnella sp. AR92]|uniref:ATP-binding cassette domain-containing protein n=1 Tax=Cohnella sp. AR92 TaxID=648716 RepID=UPI000F8E1548|nr:ATP-binding cassette domain-containing protein [Cohnella sp. AR92]RUS48252.1 ATP-binding cassette domain-containing protein [Cohnella sp. AR92]
MTLHRDADLICLFPGSGDRLRLEAGSITVLLGKNGAGKTYLLESLAGLRPNDALEVSYGSEPLWRSRRGGRKQRNPEALKAYGYASQSPEEQLVARTVEAELRETLRPYSLSAVVTKARIAASLEAVGWDETWLSRSPFYLSGGEKRRLALACQLVSPGDWLLFDEPTAGLDAPGQERLTRVLTERKQAGQGILLISHDSEWALPLADRVLLLSEDGASLRECKPESLVRHPEWWKEAGMAVPAWLEAIAPLLRRGVPVSAVWNPAKFAAGWGQTGRQAEDSPSASSSVVYRMGTAEARKERSLVPRPSVSLFDPRALWLSYVLLSLAIFAQTSWWGVAAGGALVAAAIRGGRIPLRRWSGLINSFLWFTVTLSVLAGLGQGEGGGWGFQAEAFLNALHSMARTFLVFLLGLGLSLAITPLRLRRSLSSLLGFRGRIAPPVQRFLLTVTLMLRFIPIFLSEWERFSRYAIARGKETGRRSVVGSIKRLSRTILPMLLALFRLGDQAAVSLESRGIGKQKYPTLLRIRSWGTRDTVLVSAVLVISAGLWLLR